MKKIVNSDKAPKPVGPYNQAVIFNDIIFTAGQISINPETQEFENGTIEEQTLRIIQNLDAVLSACGSGFDNILKVTIFLKDMQDFSKVNEIYAKYFNKEAPARSTVAVAALPKGALIEMELIAYINNTNKQ